MIQTTEIRNVVVVVVVVFVVVVVNAAMGIE